MKKQIFFGALACLALASCSNDKTLDVNRIEDEIRYNVVANGATKAADVYCNNNKPGEFSVWAIHNSKTYINGDVIKEESGAWKNTSGVRYWPESGNIDFYAHVNAGDKFTWDATSPVPPTITDYEVSTDVAAQNDLLYAVKKDVAKTNSAVALNFHHALSQIVFKAKNTNKNFYVEISGVKLCNINSKGTYTFPTASTDGCNNNSEPNHDLPSTINGGQGAWSGHETLVNYDVTFPFVAVDGNDTAVDLTSANTSGKEFSSNALLLLPQTTSKWVKTTNENGSYLLVNCLVYNVAGTSVDKDNDVVLWGNGTGSSATAKELAILADFNWEEGKKYTYTLVFGEGAGVTPPTPGTDPDLVLVPITFDVTVDDFVAVAGEDINAAI